MAKKHQLRDLQYFTVAGRGSVTLAEVGVEVGWKGFPEGTTTKLARLVPV